MLRYLSVATIDELRKIRLEKLDRIKRAGVWAYPIESKRTHAIGAVFSDWENLEKSEKEIGKEKKNG